MKKLFTLMAIVFIIAGLSAQSPEKMSYQAVVRDGLNKLVTNHAVGMRISIIRTSATGTVVYKETQFTNTNLNGLATIEIGTGTSTDVFSSIDWSKGPYFVKTEIDPSGGSSYSITATTQLLSVPYALLATDVKNKQWTESSTSIYFNTGKVGIGINPEATNLFQVKADNTRAIQAQNNSTLYTIYAKNEGTGAAGYFENTSNSATSYALYARNLGTGPSVLIDGTLKVAGGNTSEINREQSGTANIVPVCYGSVSAAGVKNITGSTTNFTVTKPAGTNGTYDITITDENYSQSTHCAIASLGDPGFINSLKSGNNLRITTYSCILSGSSLILSNREFSFVVFKP